MPIGPDDRRIRDGHPDPRIAIRGCPADRVPDLVATMVAAGGRIYAVDAGRETLEERFIELLTQVPDESPETASPLAGTSAP